MTSSARRRGARRARWGAPLAAVALTLGACGGGAPVSVANPQRTLPAPTADRTAVPAERPDPQSMLSRPAMVSSPFAVTDTSAYDRVRSHRLLEQPYGRGDGRVVEAHASEAAAAPHEAQIANSRLIVRGRVVEIGRPYFNSDDGGFWHSSFYPDDPVLRSGATMIFRDVIFDVDEVLATKLSGVAAGTRLRFATAGGAVRVELNEEGARKMERPPGSLVWVWPGGFDLAVGEDALVLLNKVPVGGPYNGRYGERSTLKAWKYSKYTLKDGLAYNAHEMPHLKPIAEGDLRGIVREHFGRRPQGGEPPDRSVNW